MITKCWIKHSTAFVIIITLLVGLLGCEGEKGPQGPAGPQLTGNLIGFVKLYDLQGNRLADAAGVTITVTETEQTTTTDAYGKWTIEDLLTGTYSIRIEKTGYGVYIQPSYSFVGNGDEIFEPTMFYDDWDRSEPVVYLGQIPTYSVNQIIATPDTDSDEVEIELIFTPALQKNHGFIVFVGSSSIGASSVSSDPHNYVFRKTWYVDPGPVSSGKVTISSDDFIMNGIAAGTSAFFVAYGVNLYADAYIDMETGKWNYAALSAISSNVVSVQVP